MENNAVSSTKETSSSQESSSLEKVWMHTKVKFREASYIWKINDFSLLCQKPVLFLKSEDCLVATDTTNIRWNLCFGSTRDVFVFLWPSNNRQAGICAKYRLIIYDDMQKEAKVVSNMHFFHEKSKSIMKVMCSLNDIVSADKKILSNDVLTIGWQVKYVSSIDTIGGRNCDPEFINSKCHCCKNLELMFKNQKLSDVKINISGRTFESHKVILAAASPVFLAMFESSMTEAERNYINIDDVDEETFKEMLRFIYTGNVNNIENVAYKLFAAADKYGIDKLKHICQNELCKSLTADNAVRILILADLHSADELKETVIEFIKTERVDVTKTEDFKSMTKSHCDLLAEVIRALTIK